MSNEQVDTSQGQTPPPEEPKWQFQGYFVPGHIFELLNDGKINGTDLILISIIANLVKHQSKKEVGLGCFASNKYLAERMNCHYMDVSRRIQKLKSKELAVLVEVYWKDQRYLELEWSRPAKELNSMSGEYCRLLRRALEALRNPEDEGVNNSVDGVNNSVIEGQQKCLWLVNKNVDQYNTKIIEDIKPIEETLPPRRVEERGRVRSGLILQPKSEESKASKWAKLLWERVAEKRLLNPRRSKFQDWISHFEKLRRIGPKDGPIPSDKDIDTYLKALLPHISSDMEKKYWPAIFSAKSFCDRFYQIKRKIDNREEGSRTREEIDDGIAW